MLHTLHPFCNDPTFIITFHLIFILLFFVVVFLIWLMYITSMYFLSFFFLFSFLLCGVSAQLKMIYLDNPTIPLGL